jgi:hypothetical protein
VDADHYRNRLWAYVEEKIAGSQQELILVNLKDLGGRVDRLNNAASKGIHADIEVGEVDRLLTSLLVVTHDILALTPPTATPNLEPYRESVEDFMRRVMDDDGQ